MKNIRNLNVGDNFKIKSESYSVKGSMYFEDSGYKWVEYELVNSNRKTVWLSAELSGETNPVLYEKIYLTNKEPVSEINYDGKTFTQIESGKAFIIDCYGSVDVEQGDWVNYYEYSNDSRDEYLSIEIWEDMTECSLGKAINELDISIVSESSNVSNFKGTSNFNSTNSFEKFKSIATILFFVVIFGFSIVDELGLNFSSLTGIFQSNSVESFLKKDSNFVYATAVTGDTDNKQKANVYKTNMSVSDAAKYIISKVPNIDYASESIESDSLGILSKNEYAFIYDSKDDNYKTYIQVSARKYVYTNRNSLYRSRNSISDLFYRDYYYNRGYGIDHTTFGNSSVFSNYSSRDISSISKNDSVYSSLISSARQSSVSSRSSSGGGTSFGK